MIIFLGVFPSIHFADKGWLRTSFSISSFEADVENSRLKRAFPLKEIA